MPQLQRTYRDVHFSLAVIATAVSACQKILGEDGNIGPGRMDITQDEGDTWTFDTFEEFFEAYEQQWRSYVFRPINSPLGRLEMSGDLSVVGVSVSMPTRGDVLAIIDIFDKAAVLTGWGENHVRQQSSSSPVTLNIPASDRVVTLDHNSPDYKSLVTSLEKLETALQTTNDFPEDSDKEQRIAELSAGRRLLQSLRVHAGAAMAVLGNVLTFCIKSFAGHEIGNLAAPALNLLRNLLGL
jgi:hypothetical protein